MYILKIVMNGVGETIMFRFKEEKSADDKRSVIQSLMERNDGTTPYPVDITDDFGLTVRIPPYGVLLVQKIDFEKAMEGDATWQYNQKKIHDRVITRLMAETPIIKRIT